MFAREVFVCGRWGVVKVAELGLVRGVRGENY